MLVNGNIFPGDGFADPHAIIENGRVYLFCGRDASYKIEDYCRMHKWTIISSDNLVDWVKEGDILPTDTYIGDQQNCWAGHIIKKDDTFYWYFSNKNYDTGVMTSKNVTGPFVDALGKPLIPEKMMPTSSYDPCVYQEDGVYTIFFGAGTYYCATLGDDMISLATEPEKIEVQHQGKKIGMGDKSTVFKLNDWYYLVSGAKYAMSKNLKGPYEYIGKFPGGGHNDFFIFNGKPYLSFEFHDTNIYFRGVAVTELAFNADGTVIIPDDNREERYTRREWDFTKNDYHWFMTDGSPCNHDGIVNYKLDDYIGFRSPVFPSVQMNANFHLWVEIENVDAHGDIKIIVDKVNVDRAFAKCPDIYTKVNTVTLAPGANSFKVLIENESTAHLRCIKILAAGPESQGNIKIKSVIVDLA